MSLHRTLYRQLLRGVRRVPRLVEPPIPQQWGKAHFLPAAALGIESVARAILPTPLQQCAVGISGAGDGSNPAANSMESLRTAVREGFRASVTAPAVDVAQQLDGAFALLRVLPDLQLAAHCTASATTHGVEVQITTRHLGSRDMEPEHPQHIFMYRVRVANYGDMRCQLLGRHLVFRDGEGNIVTEVPRGSQGVVGETPVLNPGDSTVFEYCSGCDLPSSTGSLSGSFHMADLSADADTDGDWDASLPDVLFAADLPPL